MGAEHSAKRPSFDVNGEVNFDHFQILRAIGKGSFGKVCIVQKRDTKKMFAMKYMNKGMCIEKDAVKNVMQEMDLLRQLDHPFIVNLWFTFQDQEDMFMVVDLLLGGDLRYHIQQEVRFDEIRVKLYICEIGLALDYLQSQHVIHRDIKPDNILLDEDGHVHITDFNIATYLEVGHVATSVSGTKPYMAPEIFACALEEVVGYSFPVDWWSLGVCAYEMLRGKRPFEIHAGTTSTDVLQIFKVAPVSYPSSVDDRMIDLIRKLLVLEPKKRIHSLKTLQAHQYLQDVNFDLVLARKIKPSFIPPKDHLNCDPTYELEEMIIEAKPLHKKKKRLAKRNSRREKEQQSLDGPQDVDPQQEYLDKIEKSFKCYNREITSRDIPERKCQKQEAAESSKITTNSSKVQPNQNTEAQNCLHGSACSHANQTGSPSNKMEPSLCTSQNSHSPPKT